LAWLLKTDRIPYENQLVDKKKEMKKILQQVTHTIKKMSKYDVPEWVKNLRGQVCPLEEIKCSPSTEGYRNKSEFAVGLNKDGKATIGFQLGQTQYGVVGVEDPSGCKNISLEAKKIRNLFQDYLEKSPYCVWDKLKHTGFWRLLIVRTTRLKQGMAILQVRPEEITKEQYEQEKNKLIAYTTEHSATVPVTSLYIQEHDGVSNAAASDSPLIHLWGDTHIYEQLLGLKFRISPTAFFQTNTDSAEVLYSLIQEWIGQIDPNTTVYDICCGTGTIGLTMAKQAKRLVGIEMVKEAVLDATFNAELNGINNATFLVGKAEDVLPNSLQIQFEGPVVGIVDPPRSGIHTKVVKAIRACPTLNRLIYVSCNPKAFVNDAAQLCRSPSNQMIGAPFRPVKAVPVDLFPHTPHTELVTLFERIKPEEGNVAKIEKPVVTNTENTTNSTPNAEIKDST